MKKTYRQRPEATPTVEPTYRDLVTVAEFGTRLEADTVAALAKEGGFEVTVRGLTSFAVLGAEAQHGAQLLLASRAEAVEVRRYLDEHGAQIIDDSSASQLNWKGAAIATATVLIFLAIAAIGFLVKGG